jgi:hypothetical protein
MPSYGAAHRKLRAMLLATYYPGSVTYWRYGQPIAEWDTSRIHLGHDDDNPFAYRGLEHARCTEAAGASKGNKTRVVTSAMRRARARRLRIW